ncbi:MAG: GDSL-type esterase/lipase family protein [Huintestinicola sp.]
MVVTGKKKKPLKFRISFILLFIFASFAACFALYMRYGSFEPDELSSEEQGDFTVISQPQTDIAEDEQEAAPVNPIAECENVGEDYLNSCMFAGDSLIVGLSSYGIIPEEQVAAGVGMSVMTINKTPVQNADGSEELIADKINAAKPENLYILLGLNLMNYYTDDQLLAEYGDFIDSIDSENTTIYVISVPPVTAAREENEENPILNSDIDNFNSNLLKFANNRGICYIDLNSALKGSDGRFSEEDAEADGIHFKKSTYRIFIDYILTHVYNG